jgi:hypothetical protein
MTGQVYAVHRQVLMFRAFDCAKFILEHFSMLCSAGQRIIFGELRPVDAMPAPKSAVETGKNKSTGPSLHSDRCLPRDPGLAAKVSDLGAHLALGEPSLREENKIRWRGRRSCDSSKSIGNGNRCLTQKRKRSFPIGCERLDKS